jgi:hypothetical protein
MTGCGNLSCVKTIVENAVQQKAVSIFVALNTSLDLDCDHRSKKDFPPSHVSVGGDANRIPLTMAGRGSASYSRENNRC